MFFWTVGYRTCLPVGCLVVFFVADFDAFVGDTPRLDTSAHKAKAQLALKVKRQPPSRSKLKESLGAGQQTTNLQVPILVDTDAFQSLNVCSVLSVFAIVSVVCPCFIQTAKALYFLLY